MGGFGDFLGRAVVGAAQGYGNFLIGEGTRQQKEKDSDAALSREQALARYRATLTEEAADKDLVRDKARISHTATENRVSTKVELAEREKIGIREESRTEGRTVRAEDRAEKRAIRADDRQLNKALTLQAAQAKAEGSQIDKWVEDDASGTVVGITKDGKIWESGVRFVRTKDKSTYADTLLGGDPATPAAAAKGSELASPAEQEQYRRNTAEAMGAAPPAAGGGEPAAGGYPVGTVIRGTVNGKTVRKKLDKSGQWVTLPN